MMKRIRTWLFWVFTIALSFIIAWACFEYLPSSAFRDNFLGNALATVIGAIIGIPIALGLGRRQQKEQEGKERQAEQRESAERKAKILKLVKRELKHNREHIVESEKRNERRDEKAPSIRGFKGELWRAFSDGGELEWITDLDLLHHISQAYHYIRAASELEGIYLQYHYYPGTYIQPRREESIPEILNQFNETVLHFIEKALDEIDKSLLVQENPER